MGIPDNLLEAARIDGAGEFRIYRSTVLPAIHTILATLAIGTSLASRNDSLWPQVVLTGRRRARHVGRLATLSFLAVAVMTAGTACTDDGSKVSTLDAFETLDGWGAFPSNGVQLRLLSEKGVTGKGMTMAFDFGDQGRNATPAYAIARKAFDIGTPTWNWAFSFKVRGDMLPNTLEFKLLDKRGENVWQYSIPEFQPTSEFHTVVVRQRQISFVSGPIGGGQPRDVATIEIVVAAESGGRGTLTIDNLAFAKLPADSAVTGVTRIAATGTAGASEAKFATDGDSSSAWEATVGRDSAAAPTLTLDLGAVRTYGGLVIQWAPNQHADTVVVDSSNNKSSWSRAGLLTGVQGVRSYLPIPDGSSRYLRLSFRGGASANNKIVVRDVSVRPLEFGATPTALLQSIARDAPRGHFPRSMHDEQIYWTVVGINGGRSEALLSEDGQLELKNRGPSLEPFLNIGGRLITWANVTATQSLLDSVRPIPSVTWTAVHATLTITAFAAGTETNSSTYARYRIKNTDSTALTGKFALALRPLQVKPPWLSQNTPGGAARVEALSWNGSVLRVNSALRVRPLTLPVHVGVTALDAGEAVSWIADNRVPALKRVVDPRALASAVLMWDVNIAAGDSTDVVVASGLDGAGDPRLGKAGVGPRVRTATNARLRDVTRIWAHDQDAVTLHVPAAAPPLGTAIKANLAWILISRDGPGFQLGSRSAERSLIRDGSLTAEALLRLGRVDEAKSFARWFARYQFPSGKVPCCVDARGANPVDEHDSHGEFIHLVYEVWRYTGDRVFATEMWPHVKLAVQFMDSLRRTQLTPDYDRNPLKAFRGLLPASISHEGYSAKSMHSVWDDGFALLGYQDALLLSRALSDTAAFQPIRASLDTFTNDFRTAVVDAMKRENVPYIPGSIELGDFDATSTATLLSPGRGGLFPKALYDSTFARYFRNANQRREADSLWEEYTPYEWRTVSALLRLGQRNEAAAMMNQFMGDRRPANWQQWAEVVWREARIPKFVGDMPNTRVGSDFIRSALDMFAYGDDCIASTDTGRADGTDSSRATAPAKGTAAASATDSVYTPSCALTIGAGIRASWLAGGDSVVVHGLRTLRGVLNYTVRMRDSIVVVHFSGKIPLPPAGIRILLPSDATPLFIRGVTVDGVRVPAGADTTGAYDAFILRLPARTVVLRVR